MILPTKDAVITSVTPLAWPDIYALRQIERDLTVAWAGEYPSYLALVDLVSAAVSWRDFVERVCTRYGGYREDYQNSLLGRDILEQIVERLPEDFGDGVRKTVSSIDAAFRQCTIVVDRPIWPQDCSANEDLFRRVPANADEDMLRDLAR